MLFRILLGCFCCRTPCHVTTKKWVTKQSRTFLWYSHSSVCFAVAINLFRDMCPHVLQIHKLLFSVGLEWTKFRNSRTLSAKCRDQGPRSARPDTCVYPWLCWYCPFVQIVAQASSQSSQKLEAEKDKDPSENYANINQSNKFQQHWALLLLNHEKFKKNPVQAPDKPGQKHEGKAKDRIYIQVKCEWIIVVGGTQNVLVTTKWQHETQLGAGNSRLQGVHSPVQNLKTWGRTELMDSNQNAALPKQIYMNQHHPVVCHAMSYFCLCNFPCSSLATKKHASWAQCKSKHEGLNWSIIKAFLCSSICFRCFGFCIFTLGAVSKTDHKHGCSSSAYMQCCCWRVWRLGVCNRGQNNNNLCKPGSLHWCTCLWILWTSSLVELCPFTSAGGGLRQPRWI